VGRLETEKFGGGVLLNLARDDLGALED